MLSCMQEKSKELFGESTIVSGSEGPIDIRVISTDCYKNPDAKVIIDLCNPPLGCDEVKFITEVIQRSTHIYIIGDVTRSITKSSIEEKHFRGKSSDNVDLLRQANFNTSVIQDYLLESLFKSRSSEARLIWFKKHNVRNGYLRIFIMKAELDLEKENSALYTTYKANWSITTNSIKTGSLELHI